LETIDTRKLAALRKRLEKTQEEVGAALGMGRTTYIAREKTGDFTESEIQKLCDFLGITRDAIIVGEIKMPGAGPGIGNQHSLEEVIRELQAMREQVSELKSYLGKLQENQVMILAAQRAYQQFWATHFPPKRMTPQDVNDAIDSRAIELAETYLSEGISFQRGS
jgi:DNA-binding XRE family transcriptional regulator